jgi:hypothetical protein
MSQPGRRILPTKSFPWIRTREYLGQHEGVANFTARNFDPSGDPEASHSTSRIIMQGNKSPVRHYKTLAIGGRAV